MAVVVLHPRNPPPPGVSTKVILFPHGGPHSAYVTDFIPGLALFAALGAIVVIPNYRFLLVLFCFIPHVNIMTSFVRGSLGYGEPFVTSLVGHISSMDVSDCLSCLDSALLLCRHLQPEPTVSVCGGSHGGFLALHLAAAAPDRFRCCVARNPVCDIPAMLATTDIPDWCYLETLGGVGLQAVVTSEQVAKMFDMSPISRIQSIRANVLLLIGAKDKRVPPSQVELRGARHHVTRHQVTRHQVTRHHVTRHQVTRHQVTRHHVTTSHVTRHTSHVTTSNVTTSPRHHVTRHHVTTSHVTTSHVTTSHVTMSPRHTSPCHHVTRHTSHCSHYRASAFTRT
jgi:pimeloyl-ACP methyl ester carboxylesterase